MQRRSESAGSDTFIAITGQADQIIGGNGQDEAWIDQGIDSVVSIELTH